MYKDHTHCRACSLGKPEISTLKESTAAGPSQINNRLIPVLDLGLQPLANDFVNGTDEHAGFAPLKVLFCPRCSLAQLSVVVNPNILYRNYSYVTSPSKTMRDHFNMLHRDIVEETGKIGYIMEFGSNDGALLRHFLKLSATVALGFDPAANLDTIARDNGLTVICDFFTPASAKMALAYKGSPDVVMARHVFCHIDDWRGTIKALEIVSKHDTLICIEVPYVVDTLERGECDQVYHEHLSFLTIKSMQHALNGSQLHIHKVIKYPIHGGSIVLMLRRNEYELDPDPSVAHFAEMEHVTLDTWRTFAERSELKIMELGNLVRDLVAKGKTVVGYGASAKSTVWINACKFTRKEIRWICDETKLKQYKNSPGSNIPIVDEGALTRELPDYAVLFAWNFAKEIMGKESIYNSKGGQWITPTPTVGII